MMRRKENLSLQKRVMVYATENRISTKVPAARVNPVSPLGNVKGPIYYDGPFEDGGVRMV